MWRGKSKLQELKGHSLCVTKIKFNSTGDLIATASKDGTCRIWQVTTGAMLRTEYFGPPVTALVWRDEESLLAGCSGGTIYLLDVKQNKAESAKRRLMFELGSNGSNPATLLFFNNCLNAELV